MIFNIEETRMMYPVFKKIETSCSFALQEQYERAGEDPPLQGVDDRIIDRILDRLCPVAAERGERIQTDVVEFRELF